MKPRSHIGALIVILTLFRLSAACAAPTPLEFQQALLALHERQISTQAVRTTKLAGKYEGAAAARYRYTETSYFDAATGGLISRIRRDAVKPYAIHVIEVNVRDASGRIVRDYVSIAQPWAPLQPTRTLINLHLYHDQLHSFRQFDLAGNVTYESCDGTIAGRRVRIGIDGDDISPQTAMEPDYQACFDGLDKSPGKFQVPG